MEKNEKAKDTKTRNYYVHRTLQKQWRDEDGTIKLYNVYGKKTVKGKNPIFFYDNLIGLKELVRECLENLDKVFDFLMESYFLKGNSEHVLDSYGLSYMAILLQLLRTDEYRFHHENVMEKIERLKTSTLFSGGYDYRKEEENAARLRSEYIDEVIANIYGDSLYIYDLRTAYLDAPPGKFFILGSSPMAIINPYIEGRYFTTDCPRYDLSGAVILLPLTPTTTLCLYDEAIYKMRTRNGRVQLNESDVDILNRIQLYNGDENKIIYKGSEEDIRSIVKKLDGDKRDPFSYNRDDEYPFSIELSCLSIKAHAEEEYEKITSEPQRDFVKKLIYWDERPETERDKKKDYESYVSKRQTYVNDIIFGKGEWLPEFEDFLL